MHWRSSSGHGPQRREPSTLYSGHDARRHTPPTGGTRECLRYGPCNEPSPSLNTLYPSATTDAPAASGDLTTLHIGGCVPALFISFSLAYSRAFGIGTSRLLLEHISLLVDFIAFTLVFELPCLVLPSGGFWFATRLL